MRKDELKLIEEYCISKNVITRNELKQFILVHLPNRNINNFRFYILDLKINNIIYQLQTNIYKYCGYKKDFEFTIDEYLNKIWDYIVEEYPDLNICIWQTTSVYNYMNLQPFKNYIFVEVDKFAIDEIYDLLKLNYHNVLPKFFLDLKGLISHEDNLIIIKNLIDKAPITKGYGFSMISHSKHTESKSVFPSPKIEKLLVDLYCDKTLMMFEKKGELKNIYENILKLYKVDFTKLLRYAKIRNVREDIRLYIENIIRFNIDIGEFND